MKHVYISGPMTGLPDLNFPAFHAAAKALRAMGMQVTNPAELNTGTNAQWEDCMRVDVKALCDCTGLVLLPGWENSRGAFVELFLARQFAMPVTTLDKLLDSTGLRTYWDQLALGDTCTTMPTARSANDQMAELQIYFKAELDTARATATKHRQRGDLERQRRSLAAAQAWTRASKELAKLVSQLHKVQQHGAAT